MPAWAAERVVVNPAQLSGPFGNDNGKIVLAGNQMIFVDDVNPANSFMIPRSQISSFNASGGVMTVNLNQPFQTAPQGSTSALTLRLLNPSSYDLISSWSGMPIGTTTATSGEAAREATPGTPQAAVPPQHTEYSFNVSSGNETGRLVIGANSIRWESLSNPDHSLSWPYTAIKSIKRDHNDTEVKVTPYNGGSYKFRFSGGPSMTDEVYNMVQDRIAAAPAPGQ